MNIEVADKSEKKSKKSIKGFSTDDVVGSSV